MNTTPCDCELREQRPPSLPGPVAVSLCYLLLVVTHGRTRAELLRTYGDALMFRIKERDLEGISQNGGPPHHCSPRSGYGSQNLREVSEQPCLYCHLDFSELCDSG